MAINKHVRRNFNTMIAAAKANNLALMECQDAKTGEKRDVICMVNRDPVTEELLFVPVGHLAEGNPYEAYRPPTVGSK